jgi:N-acetylglucosaminyl-diphospho-decaprenol L-rhamnosyltransferase
MTGESATAVMVTHNSERHVGAALAALREAGIGVRVVDNASHDRTVSLIADFFPEVDLIANRTNVGFAAAVNQALAGVDSTVVLLVDPDCVLPPGTARELIRVVASQPRIGIAGPRLTDADGRVTISAHPFETLASVLASRFGGSLVPVALRRLLCGRRRRDLYDACRGPGTPVAVDWLSGACLAVRTELLHRIGGLDDSYFLYYEDEELCLQARRRGAEVVYLPGVQAVHVGGASSEPGATWPHLYRGMLLFFARHRRRTFPVVRTVVLLRAVLGIGLAGARLPVQPRAGLARLRAWTAIGRLAVTAVTRLVATAPAETREESACTS